MRWPVSRHAQRSLYQHRGEQQKIKDRISPDLIIGPARHPEPSAALMKQFIHYRNAVFIDQIVVIGDIYHQCRHKFHLARGPSHLFEGLVKEARRLKRRWPVFLDQLQYPFLVPSDFFFNFNYVFGDIYSWDEFILSKGLNTKSFAPASRNPDICSSRSLKRPPVYICTCST